MADPGSAFPDPAPRSGAGTAWSKHGDALRAARDALRAGRLRDALAGFDAVLQQAPTDPEALLASGRILHSLGAAGAAARQLRRAAAVAPDHREAYLALGAALADADRPFAAARQHCSALVIGADARASYDYGVALHNLGRLDVAEAALRRSLAQSAQAASWLALSDVLVDASRLEEAVDACRAAAAMRPESANVHLRLGTRLVEAGNLDAGRRVLAEAVRLDPSSGAARYSLARITRHADLPEQRVEPEIRALARIAENPAAPRRQRADAGFALFKILDDRGRRKEGFARLAAANALVRAGVRYSSDRDRAYFDRIASVFDGAGPADAGPGATGDGHIFVVGLPRSGTTLAEQILASHPQVHGAGEIQTLRQALLGGMERAGRHDGYPDGAAGLDRGAWRWIGESYARAIDGAGRPVTANKTPGNFAMIPAIWRALPNARIVHCRRAPMDTCFSLYRHNFVGWGFLYAYDQEEVARFHGIHDRFMAGWYARRPGAIFELSYEALVADTEAVVRRLLDHCGLPWDDACLDFSSNPRLVRTASLEQVRRPIYRDSIGGWKRYAGMLEPMRRTLRAEGLNGGDA